VVPFNPGGMASSREWIQIDRADAADYAKDLELFQASARVREGWRALEEADHATYIQAGSACRPRCRGDFRMAARRGAAKSTPLQSWPLNAAAPHRHPRRRAGARRRRLVHRAGERPPRLLRSASGKTELVDLG
jgi:hypothetical protein